MPIASHSYSSLSLFFIFLLLGMAMAAPIPPISVESKILLAKFRNSGLSTAVQDAPKLFYSARKAPIYIKSAVKDAPRALQNLGPENFLGSGIKRKSLTGLYSVAGAVGLGASSIAYNTINTRSRDTEAVRKQQKAEETRQAVCRALQQQETHRKRSWSDATINTYEDYGKIVATTEGVAAGVLAVNSANKNLQRSMQPSQPFRC